MRHMYWVDVERTLGPNDRMYVFADDYDALAAMHTKLLKARELSAIASATMRDESVAKSKRIAELEAMLRRTGLDHEG